MRNLTQIKRNVHNLQSRIISGDRSNRLTFEMFAEIGLYQALGGREDLIKEMMKNGIVNRFDTEKAKENYINNAINYSNACRLYLAVGKAVEIKARKNTRLLLLPDLISYIHTSAGDTLNYFGMKFTMEASENLHEFDIMAHGNKYHFSDIHGTHEIKPVMISLIAQITGIKFEDYMIKMLDELIKGMVK